jgi:hypothetical protein
MRDIRACNMCSRGARKFFERHGLDWNDFLQNGVECETIEKTGDAMGLRVVAHVRRK